MRKLLPILLAFALLALGASTTMAATAANQSPFGPNAGDYSDQLVVQADGGNNVVFGVEDGDGQVQEAGRVVLNGPLVMPSTNFFLYADGSGIARGHLAPGSYAVYYGLSHGEAAGETQLSGWLDVQPEQVILHFAPSEQRRVELIGGVIYLMI